MWQALLKASVCLAVWRLGRGCELRQLEYYGLGLDWTGCLACRVCKELGWDGAGSKTVAALAHFAA